MRQLLNRRSLLQTSSLTLLTLGGCATTAQTLNTNLGQAATDAQIVAGGLPALVPVLTSFGVSASIVATVQSAITSAQSAASALSGAVLSSTGQTAAKQIAAAVLAIATALVPVAGLPVIVTEILGAAQVVVPAILSVLGIAGVSAADPAAVAQARLVLLKYGLKR
jgi:hypothetical protein